MRAGLSESVQLMEQRELNTQFQYVARLALNLSSHPFLYHPHKLIASH
jgi:hypothetical protein